MNLTDSITRHHLSHWLLVWIFLMPLWPAVSATNDTSRHTPAEPPNDEKVAGLGPVPVPEMLLTAAENEPDAAFLLGKRLYERWQAADSHENKPQEEASKRLVDEKYPANQVLQQSLYWLRQAAQAGRGEAALLLARHAQRKGNNKKMLHWYRQAAERHVPAAWLALGNIAMLGLAGQAKDCHAAARHFEQAEKLGEPWAFNNHAWMLATARDAACRNPEKAMRLWSDLDWSTVPGNRHAQAVFTDTLAAIQAGLRDFPGAIAAQRRAIELMARAVADDNKDLAEMHQRLQYYQAGKPWFGSDFQALASQPASDTSH